VAELLAVLVVLELTALAAEAAVVVKVPQMHLGQEAQVLLVAQTVQVLALQQILAAVVVVDLALAAVLVVQVIAELHTGHREINYGKTLYIY
jgi:hypothetical protein